MTARSHTRTLRPHARTHTHTITRTHARCDRTIARLLAVTARSHARTLRPHARTHAHTLARTHAATARSHARCTLARTLPLLGHAHTLARMHAATTRLHARSHARTLVYIYIYIVHHIHRLCFLFGVKSKERTCTELGQVRKSSSQGWPRLASG